MDHPRLLRLSEVKARTGLGKTKIYEMIASGDFPRPVKIGPQSFWVESEIDAWIAGVINSRNAA